MLVLFGEEELLSGLTVNWQFVRVYLLEKIANVEGRNAFLLVTLPLAILQLQFLDMVARHFLNLCNEILAELALVSRLVVLEELGATNKDSTLGPGRTDSIVGLDAADQEV